MLCMYGYPTGNKCDFVFCANALHIHVAKHKFKERAAVKAYEYTFRESNSVMFIFV